MPTTPEVQRQVIERTVELLKQLALRYIGDNVLARKLPALEETLDLVPALLVCPADLAEDVRHGSFELDLRKQYNLELTAVSKSRKLLALTNVADPLAGYFELSLWREAIVNLFRDPAVLRSTVGQVTGCGTAPGRPLDRRLLAQGYDYSPMVLNVRTQE